MSSSREPASFGIGGVLARLRAEFPDVSTSKIRFLEAEGLIEPARSQSGYRQFALADVEHGNFQMSGIKARRKRVQGNQRSKPERSAAFTITAGASRI